MVSRQSKHGLILLTLLCALSFWATRDGDETDPGPIAGLDLKINYALNNFEMRMFDDQGQTAVYLQSPRLANDAATNIGLVEAPELELHHEGFTWKISSRSATISNDQENIFLAGDVRLNREGPLPTDGLDVFAADVTYAVTPRIATSARPIRIEEPAGQWSGDGFQLDMINNQLQIMDNVNGSYRNQ